MKLVSRVFFDALSGFEIRGIGSSEVDVDLDEAGSSLVPPLLECSTEVLETATVMSQVEEEVTLGPSFVLDAVDDPTCTDCWTGAVSEMT